VASAWVRAAIGLFLAATGINLTCARLTAKEPRGSFVGLRIFTEVIIGLALAFLAALTGLMLGRLRLPMMFRLLKIAPAEAVGTNMAVGCLTALFGAALWSRRERAAAAAAHRHPADGPGRRTARVVRF
jgi:hypothetical protein